jgi:hypothetical protein
VARVFEVQKSQPAVGGEERVVKAEVGRAHAAVGGRQDVVRRRAGGSQRGLANAAPGGREAGGHQVGSLTTERSGRVDAAEAGHAAVHTRHVRRNREAGFGGLGQVGAARPIPGRVDRAKEGGGLGDVRRRHLPGSEFPTGDELVDRHPMDGIARQRPRERPGARLPGE